MIDLLKKLPNLKENEPLSKYTFFRIGGPAKYFFVAKTSEDLVKAVAAAKDAGIAYAIMGGGCNMLVSDNGFDGLWVKAENKKWTIDGTTLSAEAGTSMTLLAQETAKAGLTGFEFAAAIPGTVGGAIRGNAGAYGSEVKDTLVRARVWDGSKERWMSAKECAFSYRESIFKRDIDQTTGHGAFVILAGEFALKHGDAKEAATRVREFLQKKAATQSLELPSAGCIFKNVELIRGKLELKDQKQGEPSEFLKRELPKEFVEAGRIPTGWMIEALDLKGKTMGGAKVSDKHGNYILNTGKARAEHIIMLMSLIKQQVRDKLGIQLQEEIQLIGF